MAAKSNKEKTLGEPQQAAEGTEKNVGSVEANSPEKKGKTGQKKTGHVDQKRKKKSESSKKPRNSLN